MALAPYSARPISTRSCGSNGSEYTAMSHARLAESSSAIWSGAAPISSASAVYGRCQRVGRLGGGLVATRARLELRGGRPWRRAPAGGAATRRRG